MEHLETLLERIATALEEQNRLNRDAIALSKQWREENIATEQKLFALRSQEVEQARAWMEEQRQMLFFSQSLHSTKAFQEVIDGEAKEAERRPTTTEEGID